MLNQIVAHGLTQGLFLPVQLDMANAVSLTPVEVSHHPFTVHQFHQKLVLLHIAIGIKGSVFPLLAHPDGSHGMGVVCLLHLRDLKIGHGAAVACHEVVQPFMVHSLVLRQMVEHRVENGIEVCRHVFPRLVQQLVVGNVVTQLFSTLFQLFLLLFL